MVLLKGNTWDGGLQTLRQHDDTVEETISSSFVWKLEITLHKLKFWSVQLTHSTQGLLTVPFWEYWTSPEKVAMALTIYLMVGWCSMGTFNDPCTTPILRTFADLRGSLLRVVSPFPIPICSLQRPAKGLQWELEETNRLSSGVDFPAEKRGLKHV